MGRRRLYKILKELINKWVKINKYIQNNTHNKS